MNYFDLLATLAYPSWAALCMVLVAISIAEYRVTKAPSMLLVVFAAIAQMVAFSALSVSTGEILIVSISETLKIVRIMAMVSSICLWVYTLGYLAERWNVRGNDHTARHIDNL